MVHAPTESVPLPPRVPLHTAPHPVPLPAMSIDRVTANEPSRLLPRIRVTVPDRLRALVRGSEVWLVVLAAIVGLIAGCVVAIMNLSVAILHRCSSGSLPATGSPPSRSCRRTSDS